VKYLSDYIGFILDSLGTLSDLMWNFPTNIQWYAEIPVLGNLSFVSILLIGSGIYFSLRLKFVQIRYFSRGISILKKRRQTKTGISPLASFLLSTAMRVGPGNILGVTGAISVGGPGTLFWMWISAFFGMATAYTESTLSQIFKERKGNEYVGGLAFYGRKLINGSAVAGIFLSLLYIVYALLCFPAQGFNTLSAVGQVIGSVTGENLQINSPVYLISATVLVLIVAFASFGGIKRVTGMTNVLVPVMAVVYFLTVAILVSINYDKIPWFFQQVLAGAFHPDGIFGGAIGIAITQGVRRGLMSNEAGQGTMTMASAASDVKHPCDQGCVQSVGVFLDTMVICTLSGFVVIMGSQWLSDSSWLQMGKLDMFISSLTSLSPSISTVTSVIVSVCFGLFALTCLLGFVSFAEISANRISREKWFINSVRIACIVVTIFGILTDIAGYDLASLWNLSDIANLLLVLCNIPLLYIGFRHVLKATEDYDHHRN